MKKLHFLFFIGLFINSYSQNQEKLSLRKKQAENELSFALSESKKHNVINLKEILVKDSAMAISLAETILFNIYSQKNIENQRPYEIYHINNHWVISGTLNGRKGGVFLIIIDDRNSQILRISHGK